MKKKIALFDFDGTITREDSLLAFIRFTRGAVSFYLGFLLLSPLLIALKAKLVSNHRAKEWVLRFYFAGTPLEKFDAWCRDFAQNYIPDIVRPAALQEIRELQKEGIEVVLVSASPENWLAGWTSATGISLIGTRLQHNEGTITGRIEGRNCHGLEKVRRVGEIYPAGETEIVHAYGDTKGDLPMLKLAKNPHWKPFRN